MPGPPPQPVELKRKRGNPGKRPLPAPLSIMRSVDPGLAPPEELGDVGASEWRHLLLNCPWLGVGDLRVLRLYCIALDRHSGLLAVLADQGTVLYTDKGYAYLNPAQGALATTEAQLTKWQQLLGLTPSDRGRLGVAEVKAASTLEQLQAQRSKRLARSG